MSVFKYFSRIIDKVLTEKMMINKIAIISIW